jgi:periplasmic protein CpxP/Spy
MMLSRKCWGTLAALALVVMMIQVADAQPGGRRGGGGRGFGMFGGPPSAASLLRFKEVQDALKLTDDQKSRIETINDEMQAERRKARQAGGGVEGVQQLAAEESTKVSAVLDADQQKRLMGILVQMNGAAAALDPAVAKELNLTNDQMKQLQELHQKNRETMREARQEARGQSGDRAAMREKMQTLRSEAHQKMMAVLTTDQQAQLESLKGEKVEIDFSQLRGNRGRGGPGGPGNRSRRERGNPPARSNDSSN